MGGAAPNRSTLLVTGAAGFVGSYLVRELLANGARVVALDKTTGAVPRVQVEQVTVDLRDPGETRSVVREIAPDAVLHLAAMAFPPDAARDPTDALRTNYGAVDNLIRALVECAPEARLLYVSTAQVYGGRPLDAPPLREESELRPDSVYASTKLAAERRVELALEEDGLDVVRVRPFNHSGPGRPPEYAESSFARQVARIERGEDEPVLRVGNLEAVRDYSDVRDVVRAYALVLERGERGGVYNVASGQGRRVGAIVEHLIGRACVRIRVEVDPERYRRIDPERRALVGDAARLRALGWAPRHPFEETLDALLDAWRGRA